MGLVLSGVVACKHGHETPQPATPAPVAENGERHEQPEFAVTLTRDGESWIAHYEFADPQTALLFDTMHGAYRTSHWQPLDAGVELVNLDGIDGMFFSQPRREVRLAIRPPNPTEAVPGTRPFLRFSDGSEAFYTGQLALLTVESRAVAEALHGDLRQWKGRQPPVEVTFTGDGPVVTDRRETPETVTVTAQLGAGPYVYPGPIPAIHTEAAVLVLDPGLPAWLRDRLPADLAAIDGALERRWQVDVPDAVDLLAWEGPGDDWHNVGRAEGSQITTSILGSRYLEPDTEAVTDLLWFFAHERAHHFQLAAEVPIEEWVLEGGADAMATLVLADLEVLDARAIRRRYERVEHACVGQLGRGPLAGSRGPGTPACGDLLTLATAQALPDHDLFRFWRDLLGEASGQGARVDTSFYVYFLRREGVAEPLADAIERFATEAHADPEAATAGLLDAVGLRPDIVLPPPPPPA